ncbi:MAG TPA: DinB family protein [Balneolales bacterium]|nr:DinB family protein [Balneolales bacterium]
MNETTRIDNLLLQTMNGDAWHGPAVFELLRDIPAEKAAFHPVEDVHSIWELVEHMTTWQKVIIRRMNDEDYEPSDEENFPDVTADSSDTWEKAVEELYRTYQALREKIIHFPDEKLGEAVPGKHYTHYIQLHGLIQHNLYHAGQIAILKKNIM